MVLEIDSDEDEANGILVGRNLQDEPNWEEQRLAIVNVGRMPGVRHQIIQQGQSSEESSDNEDNINNQNFDTQLPTQHSYLGQGQEVAGRTILDEDLIQDLPIIARPGIILMPGQTLPMNFFHPTVMSVMKNLISGSKTFGVVHSRYRSSRPGLTEEATIGTTAEIYEFREPSPDSLEVGLKIKAKGRQRFRILSQRRQIDGTKIATVEILREIELSDPLYDIRLLSRDRLRPFHPEECESESDRNKQESDKNKQESENGEQSGSRTGSAKEKERENKIEFLPPAFSHKLTKFNHYRTPVYNIPLTPFPNWVYEQYDGNCLVEKAHNLLRKLRLFSQTQVVIPREPKELSFWLASNLPLDDKHKLKLLEFNCAIRRLRYQISLMEQCPVLCCRNCEEEIGKQEDIFSMSSEGPQGAYVNPGGYVHETLTLYKAKNLSLIGEPSTEYSWFPGYAWTICQCRFCDSHMGWKFTASSGSLVPKKFWGLSRRSLMPQIKMDDASNEDTSTENNSNQDEEADQLRLVY